MTAPLREPEIAFPDGEANTSAIAPETLCTLCHTRPRLGSLSRCRQCIKEAADAQLAAGAEARGRVEARAPGNSGRGSKRCASCKATKPLDEFAPHHRSRDGLRKFCRFCVRAGRGSAIRLRPEQVEKAKVAAAKPARRARNRQAVAAWSTRHSMAARVRNILRRAVAKGRVARPASCQIAGCEATKLVAHHHDYGLPLNVLYLCRSHHAQLHHGVALKLKPGLPARLKRLPRPEVSRAGQQSAGVVMQVVA